MGGGSDTTGKLLADIANLISEGLRVLSLSDKRQWGPDEHEQVSALEAVLDEARKDFQELGPLVNGQSQYGQSQYEHDRRFESITELKTLCAKFQAHVHNLKDWSRSGGPINPVWTREVQKLKRDLHRTQCRVAMRIFTSSHEVSERCLGAFLVHRVQRARRGVRTAGGTASATSSEAALAIEMDYDREKKKSLEELNACRSVGTFQRFGEQDIAFVCDFCDGHLVWTDLEHMPASRSAPPQREASSANPPAAPPSTTTTTSSSLSSTNWQATGTVHSGEHQKQIIFAPVAIANHIAPLYGDWEARYLCPLCEEMGQQGVPDEDAEDMEDSWRPGEDHFDDLASLQEHLEWQHGPSSSSMLPIGMPEVPSAEKCVVM